MSAKIESEVTEEDVERLIQWSYNLPRGVRTRWMGLTYEQGVRAALEWITGNGEAPDKD